MPEHCLQIRQRTCPVADDVSPRIDPGPGKGSDSRQRTTLPDEALGTATRACGNARKQDLAGVIDTDRVRKSTGEPVQAVSDAVLPQHGMVTAQLIALVSDNQPRVN